MPISFERISVGASYSRETLARLWGYSSFHALARGVVTPQGDNLIILFVTEEQQTSSEQYVDRLIGNVLYWEGPNDHFAETRMVNSAQTGDQIHLFYREKHHSDFTYLGVIEIVEYTPFDDKPSKFVFQILNTT